MDLRDVDTDVVQTVSDASKQHDASYEESR